ncbi:hypothetical protein SCG7086_BT_00020 [Chlamydiales bacterium SCGC AG-110-P3]|nr:hypothetical protein SCG7086_BT_00020 [Chlamydiales bacterium SCGC AG-110-P3]
MATVKAKAKNKPDPKFIIGIDLGTTNCTMAYAPVVEEGAKDLPLIERFQIPQVTASGMIDKESTLPSFVYFPLDAELSAKTATVEWAADREHCVGLHARERGAEVPDRLVSSAKSWLCHDGIDRREAILPGGNAEDGLMSPVDGCCQLLVHLREAWTQEYGKDAPFVEQTVLVTVPASFDPSARQLVQEAAEKAGYPEIILLEEPQAAFYSWLQRNGDSWRDQLAVDQHVLVVDVGGGTTDFTLVKVTDEDGDLGLERVAVGSHLLLGGDNMDLACAYLAKGKLEDDGHEIDDWQMQSLVHASRKAKEILLGDNEQDTCELTIHGRGSSLVKGTLSASVTREEAHALLVEGFAPLVAATDRSKIERRSGLQQVGLPFAQDPRLSSQLAKFLSMTGEDDSDSMKNFVAPAAVLFNGGTMKAQALRSRIVEQLNQWAGEVGSNEVIVLAGADYDFSVSHGAVGYGFARSGNSIRIKGGTSRSYYIGVEEAAPAVPGVPAPMTAVCVVPFGMEEGTELELDNREFALVLGQMAHFRFFSHATSTLADGSEPMIGTAVRRWKKELVELHPIETVLDRADKDGKTVKVRLKSVVTELGVLELWCVAADGREWKLEFDVRMIEDESVTDADRELASV